MRNIILKRSRRSFFVGYLLAFLFMLIFFSIYVMFSLSGFILYLLSFPAIYLLLLPEYTIANERVIIKPDSVEGITGIFGKKKTIIPIDRVANVGITRGVFGRILDYGNVFITGIGSVETRIVMRGVSSPEKVLRKIEEKMGKK